jgi:hypothetical protein
MGVMETIKRALMWAGVMPLFSDYDVKEAEIENFKVDRERTIGQLSETTQRFKDKTQEILASVDRGKNELLGHIESISSSQTYTAVRKQRSRYRYRRRYKGNIN